MPEQACPGMSLAGVRHDEASKRHSSQEGESACKPGSVKDNHSSGMYVAIHLLRPTRGQCGQHYRPLIWPCSRRGLPCRACCQPRGALLPHHFTLTRPGTGRAVYFLLHFPSARAAQELPGALPMWSPDFPLPQPAWLNQAVTAAIARLTPGYILVRNRTVCHLRHSRARLSDYMVVPIL